ncbi:MAG: hypothetical protein U9R08_05220 [Nanoarchaeota archaeon]|nr:hypothetical protein [Nanoarchaeota archaeon]
MSENKDSSALSQIETLVAQARVERDSFEAESDRLKHEIEFRDEDIQKLTTELDSKGEQYVALQVRLDEERQRLQDELVGIQQGFDSKIQAYEAQLEDVKGLYQQEQGTVLLLKRENAGLKLDVEESLSFEENNKVLHQEIESLAKELSELSEQYTQELDSLRIQLDEQVDSGELAGLEAKLKEKDTEIDGLQSELHKNKLLLRLTANVQKDNETLVKKCEGVKQDCVKLSRDNESLRGDYAELQKVHDELKIERDEFRSSYQNAEIIFNDVEEFVKGVTEDDPVDMFFALQKTYPGKSVDELIEIHKGIQMTPIPEVKQGIVSRCKDSLYSVGSSLYTLPSKVFTKNNALILGVSTTIVAGALATLLYATGEHTKVLETVTNYIKSF